MKIVIPGGSGQVGQLLTRGLKKRGHDITIISRHKSGELNTIQWNGKELGEWAESIDGADVVINLAGRSVNCRYNKSNLKQMMDSRIDSTRIIGQAISRAKNPPKVWLQASTATIYAHRFDANNDESTGIIGGNEPDVPAYWKYSIDIATSWERTLNDAHTPNTRKVAMRSAMVMSPDKNGIFDSLLELVRKGLGGAVGGGKQYISWVHELDFVRAIEFLIENENLKGAVNIAAPNPLTQKEFMKEIRTAWGIKLGLPATKWIAEIGAFFMRTDTELIFKSRRVVSKRLQDAGFEFEFQSWTEAVKELVKRSRGHENDVTLFHQ